MLLWLYICGRTEMCDWSQKEKEPRSESLCCFKESLNSFWQFFTTLSSSQLLLFLESCIIFFLASSVLFPDAGDTLLELTFMQRTQVVNFLHTCLAILVCSEREFVSSWRGFPLYMWVGLCPHEARTLNVRAHCRLCSSM